MNPTKCNLKVLASLLFNFHLLMSSKLHPRLYFWHLPYDFSSLQFLSFIG